MARLQVQYEHKASCGRRYAKGLSCQSLPQRVQRHALAHTHDLDIKNCLFTVVHQLVKRLDLEDPALFAAELEVLASLRDNRDEMIRTQLGANVADGKAILHTVISGGHPPQDLVAHPLLEAVGRLSRMLRWLSCSILNPLYHENAADDTKWAESSTFAIFWQRAEDYILRK